MTVHPCGRSQLDIACDPRHRALAPADDHRRLHDRAPWLESAWLASWTRLRWLVGRRTEFRLAPPLLRHQKNDAVLQELARVHGAAALKRCEPRASSGPSALDVHFVLPRAVASPRLRKIERIGNMHVHHLRLTKRADFDRELAVGSGSPAPSTVSAAGSRQSRFNTCHQVARQWVEEATGG